jgi:hypothetical protein
MSEDIREKFTPVSFNVQPVEKNSSIAGSDGRSSDSRNEIQQ